MNRCGTPHGDECALGRVGDRMGIHTCVLVHGCSKSGHAITKPTRTCRRLECGKAAVEGTTRASGAERGVWAACRAPTDPAFHLHPAIPGSDITLLLPRPEPKERKNQRLHLPILPRIAVYLYIPGSIASPRAGKTDGWSHKPTRGPPLSNSLP